MGLLYTATFENVAVSATQDLFELIPDIHYPARLHSLFLSNVGADVGDAAEEMMRITVRVLTDPTEGTGGGAAGVSPIEGNSGSGARSTANANNTGKATAAGLSFVKAARGWNIRGPFEIVWTPETRPGVCWDNDSGVDAILVVRLENSPADAISMSGEMTWEEIGPF
jgi:hypothetical protein